jgi:hypothetical protein
MLDVNVIITCHNREEYVPYLLEILKGYRYIKVNPLVCYNGDKLGFYYDLRLPNYGHSLGDMTLTLMGYRLHKFLHDSTRYLKLCADCWLFEEERILDIFLEMDKIKAVYGGSWWNDTKHLSSDIFFVNTAHGNIFEGFFQYEHASYEALLFRTVTQMNLPYYIIPQRINGCSKRHSSRELKWVMHHNIADNIAAYQEYSQFKTLPDLSIKQKRKNRVKKWFCDFVDGF